MEGQHTADVEVGRIMSRPVVAIRSDCDLDVAVDTFLRTALRHLVVVDPDRTVAGILAVADVLAALGTTGPDRQVGAHANPVRRRVHPHDSVRRAAEVMLDELVDAVPVCNHDGRVVGLVTWADIVALVARRDLLGDGPQTLSSTDEP